MRARHSTGGFAQRLVGHNSSESVDILRTLQAYITRPENTVRWHWREGDVAIWDNRSTQHYAIYDYGKRHRQVQRVDNGRVTPVGLDGRESISIQGDATQLLPGELKPLVEPPYVAQPVDGEAQPFVEADGLVAQSLRGLGPGAAADGPLLACF